MLPYRDDSWWVRVSSCLLGIVALIAVPWFGLVLFVAWPNLGSNPAHQWFEIGCVLGILLSLAMSYALIMWPTLRLLLWSVAAALALVVYALSDLHLLPRIPGLFH